MGQTYKLGRTATTVATEDHVTRVTYHHTVVVEFTDKYIVLRTGGWKTVTTKARMNQASNQFDLGYQVSQSNFIWYVSFKGKSIEFPNSGTCRLIR